MRDIMLIGPKNHPWVTRQGEDPLLSTEEIEDQELDALLRETKWMDYYRKLKDDFGDREDYMVEFRSLSHFTVVKNEGFRSLRKAFDLYSEKLCALIDECDPLPLKWINTKE